MKSGRPQIWWDGTSTIALVVRYALFAGIATLVNLATQAFVTSVAASALAWSMGAGTVTGFAAKYVLDKYWIFSDGFEGRMDEVRKIILYGLFSVGTTFLFWLTEIGFWLFWHTDLARYFGAILGLSIGYWLKYHLDRTYTFRTRTG
jgi:putative flippase GtrA